MKACGVDDKTDLCGRLLGIHRARWVPNQKPRSARRNRCRPSNSTVDICVDVASLQAELNCSVLQRCVTTQLCQRHLERAAGEAYFDLWFPLAAAGLRVFPFLSRGAFALLQNALTFGLGAGPRRAGELVTQLARAAGKFIALDPKPKRKLAFHSLDLITPNKRESLELAGLTPAPHTPYPAAEVCTRLHERYSSKHLVITLGEEGMLLSAGGKIICTIPTAAREVFDVSGAGDTALAALVLALTAGAKLENAALFANAAAGVVVGKLGTATVSPAELRAYVAQES